MKNIAFDYSLTPFTMNFKRINRSLKTWKEEIVSNAQYIKTTTNKPIIVALSGGIDSEVACRSFLEAGIKFSVLTVAHKNKTNEHDISYAKDFCKKFNIEQDIVEIDPINFFTECSEKYSSQGYTAHNIFRYLQLFLLETIENMGGCGVLGGGEQLYYNVNDVVNLKYFRGILFSLEWIKNNNTLHFPYFFQTTPEVVAAYLEHDLIQLLTSDPRYYTSSVGNGVSFEKMMVYHSSFPDMQRRDKYHGFENISDFRVNIQADLLKKFSKNEIYMPVTTVKSQLGV